MLRARLNLYQAVPAQAIPIHLRCPTLKTPRGPLESMPFVSAAPLFHT